MGFRARRYRQARQGHDNWIDTCGARELQLDIGNGYRRPGGDILKFDPGYAWDFVYECGNANDDT